MRNIHDLSRRRPSAARPRPPTLARLERIVRRLDAAMGELNHYLGAVAIGLLVLNLTALVLLAPRLTAPRVRAASGCSAPAEMSVPAVNAELRAGT